MTSLIEPSDETRALWAVASAVYVAVTKDIDHPDGGDDPVAAVTDTDTLRTYVESYLDGYEVTPESLTAAVTEGTSLTEPTLKELISQASAAGMSVDEFFDGYEFEIEGALSAAASFVAGGAPKETSIREQVFEVLQTAEGNTPWLFIKPSDTVTSSFAAVRESAEMRIESRGMPENTTFAGWSWGRDFLRPDGTIKKGEDRQEVAWGGDADLVRSMLLRTEAFGFVVEGGEEGSRFRLVPAGDASSSEPFVMPKRADLLTDHDASGSAEYGYSKSWVEKTRRPKSEEDWLTAEEAAELFNADSAVDIFISQRGADDALTAWSIKLRPRKSAVVTHYHDPSGSVARIVNLEFSSLFTNGDRRGSFVRRKVIDAIWPEGHAKYAPKTHATSTITLTNHGDIASVIEKVDRSTGETSITKHREGASRRWWVTYPLFGEWAPIVDPWYGEPQADSDG